MPPKIKKSRENPIKFDLTAVQGHPMSSILVSMDFLLVTVTLAVSATAVFEIFMLRDRKLLILPTPPLFDGSARVEPLRISGRNLPRKN